MIPTTSGGAPSWLTARRAWALALGLVAVHVVLAWLARPPGVLVAQDDATYILLGRSLRALDYRELFHVGLPLHGLYPPVFPALLGGVSLLAGESWDVLTAATILASAGTLVLLFDAVRRLWSPGAALLCLLALAVNPALVTRAGTVRAEPVYALLAVLVLWILSRQDEVRGRRALAAGVVALLAVFTRSIGVTLVVALGLHWLLDGRLRAATVLGVATLVLMGGWVAWAAHVSRERPWAPSYVQDALRVRQDTRAEVEPSGTEPPVRGRSGGLDDLDPIGFAEEMAHRVFISSPETYLVRSLPYVLPLPTVRGTVVDNAVGGLLMVVGLLAGLVSFARKWRSAALYVGTYGVLLAAWSWKSGRFLEPLLFLLVPMVLLGLYALFRRWRPRFGYPAMAAMALVLTVTGAARSAEVIRARSGCPELEESLDRRNDCVAADVAAFFELVGEVESRVPDSAVFLTSKPEPLYLYAGNRSVPYGRAMWTDGSGFVDYLRREGVDYVILASMLPNDVAVLAPRLRRRCEEFRLLGAASPRAYLFEVLPSGAAKPDGRACAAVDQFLEANRGRRFGEGYPDHVEGVPPVVRPGAPAYGEGRSLLPPAGADAPDRSGSAAGRAGSGDEHGG